MCPALSPGLFLSGPCCWKKPRWDPCGPRDLWPSMPGVPRAGQWLLLFSSCPLWGLARGWQGASGRASRLVPGVQLGICSTSIWLQRWRLFCPPTPCELGGSASGLWRAVTQRPPSPNCCMGGWATQPTWENPWGRGSKTWAPSQGCCLLLGGRKFEIKEK